MLDTPIQIIDYELKSALLNENALMRISESNLRRSDSDIPLKDIPAGHEFIDRWPKTRCFLLIIGEIISLPT